MCAQVVKRLWAYIKEHELQDPKNRRKIRPDAALLKLFKPPLDMFKMNKQLSRHVFAGGARSLRPSPFANPLASLLTCMRGHMHALASFCQLPPPCACEEGAALLATVCPRLSRG
jgi:hypothetical protein